MKGREERRMQKSKQEKEHLERIEERGQRIGKYKEDHFAPCSFSLRTGEIPLMSQILTRVFFALGREASTVSFWHVCHQQSTAVRINEPSCHRP